MMMKNILHLILFAAVLMLGGCKDFFDVDTDGIMNGDDYISAESEMYAGYIGIITKVQAIGDKSVYLTDTRAELLEPTENASSELYSLYNYDTDLTGNSYADPSGYYEVIIACNDYLAKMKEYQASGASYTKAHFTALVSCTLRVKAWIYLTLAKIYGEAIWFDDSLQEYTDLSKQEVSDWQTIMQKCRDLLEQGAEGLKGIDGTETMSWKEWIDPNTATGESAYRYWDYMTPDYVGLYAEICLWLGDYQTTASTILNCMNGIYSTARTDAQYWNFFKNKPLAGKYRDFWNGATPYAYETASAILYDYTQNQTNSLLRHFGTEAPNEYLLRPSEVGRARFLDEDFNPLGNSSSDTRRGSTYANNSAGQYVITKYRPLSKPVRTYPYQDDVHIYIYRGSDYNFMLAEALNNMGRIAEAEALINQGLIASFPAGGVTWDGFSDYWTNATPAGDRKYGHLGIRGSYELGSREFSNTDILFNDKAILDEMMLEFGAEGRTLPAMIRMALRHNDPTIIADRVCPKYSNPDDIRGKINAGGYFIKWNYSK